MRQSQLSLLLSQHLFSVAQSNTNELKRAGLQMFSLARLTLAMPYQKIVLLNVDYVIQERYGMKPCYVTGRSKMSRLFYLGPLFQLKCRIRNLPYYNCSIQTNGWAPVLLKISRSNPHLSHHRNSRIVQILCYQDRFVFFSKKMWDSSVTATQSGLLTPFIKGRSQMI